MIPDPFEHQKSTDVTDRATCHHLSEQKFMI